MIPNTSRKPHVLENSGLGCTVVTRPLFLRLSHFFDFFVWYNIMTEWCKAPGVHINFTCFIVILSVLHDYRSNVILQIDERWMTSHINGCHYSIKQLGNFILKNQKRNIMLLIRSIILRMLSHYGTLDILAIFTRLKNFLKEWFEWYIRTMILIILHSYIT